MSECYCDFESPDFYRTNNVGAARKVHRCYECGSKISIGDSYEYKIGKWDGDVRTYKTCRRCVALRDWVKAHVPCFCWMHGSMLEDAYNTVDTYCGEAPGLMFGFMRKLYAVRSNRVTQ